MELLILDQGGNVIARSIEKIAAGQSVTLKFNGDTLRRPGSLNRLHLRALVRFLDPPDPELPAPRIVGSLEVVDNFTGRTSFAFRPRRNPTGSCGRRRRFARPTEFARW